MNIPLSLRVAAVILLINGLGFGAPCVLAIRELAAGRGIPLVMGFPAYGGGPFERFGIASTVPLVAGFLLVCVLECVAGGLVWGANLSGAILALVVLVPAAIYWWGFALPFGPLFALLSTALILLNWSSFAPGP